MVKMSASFVKGTTTSIKHNNRDFKEKDWETKYHNHINREREKHNKYLRSTPIREKYDELFGEEVERYNATQKRKDRKIDDYFDYTSINGELCKIDKAYSGEIVILQNCYFAE
jgi:hypothetical protein